MNDWDFAEDDRVQSEVKIEFRKTASLGRIPLPLGRNEARWSPSAFCRALPAEAVTLVAEPDRRASWLLFLYEFFTILLTSLIKAES
jgi:hypothetical protein